MRTKEIVGAILALTIFLGLAPIALADAPGTPFQVGGHVYLDATPVSGADVTVTNQATGEFLTDTTESTGAYVVSLSNLPGGHSAGDTIQVTATYNGQTGTSSAPRSENLDDSPQIINVIIAQAVQIRAGDGGDLPESILVGETFTVLITEDGISVGAGTNVTFRLPYDTGSPTLDTTDADGKAQYLPENTGILGIRVLDGLVTVVEATVNVVTTIGEIPTLGSITISPDSPDPLNVGGSLTFTATCKDANGVEMTCPTLTWDSSNEYAGTITDTGFFEALHTGRTEIYAANSSVSSNKVEVTVNEPAVNESVSGTNFTVPVGDDISVIGNFTTDTTGEFVNATPLGNATDPDYVTNGTTLGLGGNIPIKGVNMEVSQHLRDEMAEGNGSLLIEMRYNDTELAAWGITDETTLEIYKFNKTIGEWELVKDQWYYVAGGSGRDIVNNEVWATVTELSPFALVGTKSAPPSRRGGGGGGGGGGPYPPGWGGTPTATHGVTPGVTPGATPTTPVTEVGATPARTAAAGTTPAAEGEAAPSPTKKKGLLPGFEGVFAIAGLLAVAYLVMRKRRT